MIEKFPIYYLSSASLLQFVKEKRKAGGEKVLAFGNPDLGDPEKNLEHAELEAQEVQAIYPEASVLLRKDASEEKSKSLSPAHDILHFATHAELNENDPLSSAVLLAKEGKEDGRLEVREIFGMDSRPIWWFSVAVRRDWESYQPAMSLWGSPGRLSTPAHPRWWQVFGVWTTVPRHT